MVINRLKPHIPERKTKPSHYQRLKQTILMKNTPLEAGIFAVLSPIPLFLLAEFWAVTTVFGVFIGVLGVDTISGWLLAVSLLPLLLSPALGVISIIHGFKKIKEKQGWSGIVLGVVCLLENAVIFLAVAYLGYNY